MLYRKASHLEHGVQVLLVQVGTRQLPTVKVHLRLVAYQGVPDVDPLYVMDRSHHHICFQLCVNLLQPLPRNRSTEDSSLDNWSRKSGTGPSITLLICIAQKSGTIVCYLLWLIFSTTQKEISAIKMNLLLGQNSK